MNVEATLIQEMRRHPRIIFIIVFISVMMGGYGVRTYAEKSEVIKLELSLKSDMVDLKYDVKTKFDDVDKKLMRFERIAEKRHLESSIDDISTEIFNLKEVILPTSVQPTKIKQQIYKYEDRKDRLNQELLNVMKSINELSKP